MANATLDQFDVYVCIDCGYFLANGMPDEPDKDWSPDKLKARWDGYHLVNGDSGKDHDFSWSPCSGGTRSDIGRDCRDAFLSLAKTCAKLKIAFRDYLGDRLVVPGATAIPYLPEIILARARPL